ncbi:UDP-4-amino-4,6-dideoxy-N-acetyl-beta-L-altrosamine N-acetyltransferase [Alteromonas confluentis]|uniref:UDP-4-amino-4, 6-dideoxy-N-acetyl-beta-L-altrosamine N-acetyltransferase n=1 Tax=Alteromonas confluentis TaxID=1656094 RepID=A0A1E7Z5W5_9ALTE|nr:UDP-4-amino-4,6-dideoxy-N-acetyl-beta-L-altrosamine N-acetyltransferase [Alteromonas confluentis]OFC68943.1 UDP-4-amino-4,6-dideoxy-N-acetyl-beta-L-altrosamine N-acetyltransferase [Alteromonas confluentis]
MERKYPSSHFSLLNHTQLERVLAWRNKPHIRQNMHQQDTITLHQHLAWFENLTNDPTRVFFVMEQNERPIGVLNFTLKSENPLTLEWGCYLGEDDVWPGSGLLLEIAALEFAFTRTSAERLYAEVLSFNTSVLKLHKLFNYTPLEDGDTITRSGISHTVKRFEYTRMKWLTSKDELLARLPKQIAQAAHNISFENEIEFFKRDAPSPTAKRDNEQDD